MSKVKRILSVIMAMVMVLAMSVPTFADASTPSESDTHEAKVTNIEANAEVYAYQIVKGDYNTNGFVKYVKANNQLVITDVTAPTSEEVTTIAANKIGTSNPLNLKKVKMNSSTADPTTYSANLEAGYWIVLVKATTTTRVYNPMLVGVYYSVSGSNNMMEQKPITNATGNWTLEGTDAYAKSTNVTITKTAKDTANIGEDVEFTVTAVVPDYSAEYTKDVTYEITDKLTNLKFADHLDVTVSVSADHTITENDYTVDRTSNTEMKVTFKSEWVKANGLAEVTLKYEATMTGDAVNNEAHENEAKLTYTNNPDESTGSTQDTEKVYTFDIDGIVTGDILKKVKDEKDTDGKNIALPDAEFTLYTDAECTNRYYNTKHPQGTEFTTKSDVNGKLYITGLAEGTYYLKETKAPNKYTLNNTVYKIEVKPTIENEELKSWEIIITPVGGASSSSVTNGFTVSQETAAANDGNATTDILNTKISTLPSTGGIGTTIFTIGGCAIMIVAAGLFFATRRKTQK